MIGESMFYLEDEHTDLIIGDPLQEDVIFLMADEAKDKSKDPAGKENPKVWRLDEPKGFNSIIGGGGTSRK